MKRPVLMDGAVGTTLWEIAESRNIEKVPVWKYSIEHPEIVSLLHAGYIEAGAKIILADTFGANRHAVKRSSPYTVEQVVRASVRLALKEAQGTDVKVFAAAGPLSVLLEPYGDLSAEECAEIYHEQLAPAVQEGVQGIYLQTFMDLAMMKIAAEEALKFGLPVFCTMTFEKVGKTMFGNSVKDTIDTLAPLGISAIGMNCSLGPDLAVPIIQQFHELTSLPLIFKPNAGKPILAADGTAVSTYDADTFVTEITPALGIVDYIGGCCGANAEYIRKLNEAVAAM